MMNPEWCGVHIGLLDLCGGTHALAEVRIYDLGASFPAKASFKPPDLVS